MRTIFDRPLIRYLAFGQQSDYQCERIAASEDYYFHSYDSSVINTYVDDIMDFSFNGNGAKVKYCGLNAGGPGVWSGYIIKKLHSNCEQCNRIIDHTRDDVYNWYVKPRIRIDTAFANNPNNQNDSSAPVGVSVFFRNSDGKTSRNPDKWKSSCSR